MSMSRFQPTPKKLRLTRNERRSRGMPVVEPLDRRVMLSVTALFAEGTLRVTGDDQDNVIAISRTAAGAILVNSGAVPIQGGTPTVANTNHFHLVGAGGDDQISLSETNGALPGAALFGGAGNDTLTGGSAADFADGEAGNDTVLLGGGDDEFQWNPGDGSDVVDGQGGADTILFNGADAAEKFELSDTGAGLPFHHVRLTRDVGSVNMDLAGLETVDLNTFGGADAVTVNDLSATDVVSLNLDLDSASHTGTGDNAGDAVIVDGTNADDGVQIASSGLRIAIGGLFPFVNVTGEDGLDALTVNTLGGNDVVDAANLSATNASQLIKLTVVGGAGNDTLSGSQGADTFVWNSGDGSDIIDGGENPDTIVFNGSDGAEALGLSTSGSRARFTRDVDGVTTEFGDVEEVDVNPLGGADAITVNDLTGTAVTEVRLNLAGTAGGTTADAQPDSVVVNGRNAPDSMPVVGRAGVIVVDGGFGDGSGLPYFTVIRAVEAADSLRINGNGGSDTIDVDLDNTRVNLSVDAGAQHDTVNVTATGPVATAATVTFLPSTGDDDLNVNTDGNGIANVRFDTAQRIGALAIGNGGLATLNAGGANVLTVTSLDIAVAGKLDLNDNALIIDYSGASPIADTESLLRRGYNGGGWNGSGIMTGLGNASTFALGFAEASEVAPGGSFAGQSVDRTSVVVKFTLYGDATLDGTVDFSDLVKLAQSYNTDVSATTLGSWSHGDFTYDGVVNFDDLVKLAQNYNTSLPAAVRAPTQPAPTLAVQSKRPVARRVGKAGIRG